MKITKSQLQQVIREEVAKEINEAVPYRRHIDVALTEMMKIAQSMGLSQEIMDDLMAIKTRHGGMKPGTEPVGDIDMKDYDI